jgi:hypothetical protein
MNGCRPLSWHYLQRALWISMRTLAKSAVFAIFLIVPTCAAAKIEGVFHGRVVVEDARVTKPPTSACIRFDPAREGEHGPHCIFPVRRVIVSATVIGPTGLSLETLWTQTDGDGNFVIFWTDSSRNSFPTRLRFKVHWYSTRGGLITSTRNTKPGDVAFEIDSSDDTTISETVGTVNVDDDTTREFQAEVSDESHAYLTAVEVFRRIVRWSDLLKSRMRKVHIKVRDPALFVERAMGPTSDLVLLNEGLPFTEPEIVAHELGHLVTWNALNLHNAPLNPVIDYEGRNWCRSCLQTERVAFLEGMADFWSLVWQFKKEDGSGTVFLHDAGADLDVERGKSVNPDPGETRINCRGSTSQKFRRPFCQTVGLWDLYDANGSDGVRMSVADIVNALNRFPNNCIENGCTEEPRTPMGDMNHHDFLRRIRPRSVRRKAREVFDADGLDGGSPSP